VLQVEASTTVEAPRERVAFVGLLTALSGRCEGARPDRAEAEHAAQAAEQELGSGVQRSKTER